MDSIHSVRNRSERLRGGVGRCSRSSHTAVYAPGAALRPPPPPSRSLRFLSLCIKAHAYCSTSVLRYAIVLLATGQSKILVNQSSQKNQRGFGAGASCPQGCMTPLGFSDGAALISIRARCPRSQEKRRL